MVLVNGKSIKVYELDTLLTFTRRLAGELDSLIDYLYFIGGIKESDIRDPSYNIIVENIFEKIIKGEDVIELFQKMPKGYDINKFFSIWLYYNPLSKSSLQKVFKRLVDEDLYISERQLSEIQKSKETIKKLKF